MEESLKCSWLISEATQVNPNRFRYEAGVPLLQTDRVCFHYSTSEGFCDGAVILQLRQGLNMSRPNS